MFDRWDRLDKKPLDVGSKTTYVRRIESLRAEPKMSTATSYGQCRGSIPQRLVKSRVKEPNEALFLLSVSPSRAFVSLSRHLPRLTNLSTGYPAIAYITGLFRKSVPILHGCSRRAHAIFAIYYPLRCFARIDACFALIVPPLFSQIYTNVNTKSNHIPFDSSYFFHEYGRIWIQGRCCCLAPRIFSFILPKCRTTVSMMRDRSERTTTTEL